MESLSRAREKLSRVSMTELRRLVAAVAGPKQWTDTRDSWLHRAARRAGLGDRMMKRLFYAEIDDPDHPAVVKLMEAAAHYETENLADRLDEMAQTLRRLIVVRGRAGEPCLPLSKPR